MLPYFYYCLLLWGSVIKEKTLFAPALKDGSKNNYQQRLLGSYRTHMQCKKLGIVNISDMISVALWKFYYRLMNKKLPQYFLFQQTCFAKHSDIVIISLWLLSLLLYVTIYIFIVYENKEGYK